MELQWLGLTSFRIAGEGCVVLADPPDETGWPEGVIRADIVTHSQLLPATKEEGRLPGSPFVIAGPGEYEVGGVFVVGVRVPGRTPEREDTDLVTAYCVTLESLTVCHLGPACSPPTQEQVEALGAVDILLVPVGGSDALTPADAVEVVSRIEPTLVVPMRYGTHQHPHLEPLARFCEEMGICAVEPVPMLSVSRSRLPIERQVVVLQPIERPA